MGLWTNSLLPTISCREPRLLEMSLRKTRQLLSLGRCRQFGALSNSRAHKPASTHGLWCEPNGLTRTSEKVRSPSQNAARRCGWTSRKLLFVPAGRFSGFDAAIDEQGVLLITFNEPERMNGITTAMRRDFIEVLVQAQLEDSVRVVVLTGTGSAFCAGNDVKVGIQSPDRSPSLVPDQPVALHVPVNRYGALRTFSQTVPAAIRALDKLTIAAINGFAIQSGLSMALACDFRIASSTARLGSATLRMGFQPDENGHWLLVETIGVPRTMDFLMRKRILSAEDAERWGLVHEVVRPEALLERAIDFAHELALGPQVAMRMLKRAVYNAARLTFEQSGEDIALRAALSDFHEDAREGRTAFVEKREPSFNAWLRDDSGR